MHSAYSDTYGGLNDIIMTSEQSRVVVHPVQAGKTIKVIAFAGIHQSSMFNWLKCIVQCSLILSIPGTGKTTTLVQFAKRNYHLNIGYCVYNKSVLTYM